MSTIAGIYQPSASVVVVLGASIGAQPQASRLRIAPSALLLTLKPSTEFASSSTLEVNKVHARSVPYRSRMSSLVFKHNPLTPARRQIRLVRIIQAPPDHVECEVRAFDFTSDPIVRAPDQAYVALSYAWGDPLATRDIILNGQHFEIRQNLYDYLCHAHYNQEDIVQDRWLWIDQISIDQSNIRERNRHVSMMTDIYAQATSVVIWLGSAEKRASRVAISFLNSTEFGQHRFISGLHYRLY